MFTVCFTISRVRDAKYDLSVTPISLEMFGLQGRSVGFYPGMEMFIASPFIFSPPLAQAKLPAQVKQSLSSWPGFVLKWLCLEVAPASSCFAFCFSGIDVNENLLHALTSRKCNLAACLASPSNIS